ncbi:DUF2726 domain-containing protein [Oryzomonas japonica]|uniref:DUF2726 domain-containing protein n=1 Tax=Oryzomonas japonica TaxID=2603858 RepID=A0A7J4ZTL5_9BACT|nr:DUF2726 domain-containing protein [Oryzomonas japonica]KAB0666810.1 DUF2726 domain-containing protein [Oryzomonas japonica]
MNLFIGMIIIILIVIGLLAAGKNKKPSNRTDLQFTKVSTLFTPAERSFLGVLEQAIGERYRVFGKVRVGDIMTPAKGLTASKRTTARNMIDKKHVDFLICSAADLIPLGVIELDDKTHERKDRADRDDLIDKALASARIPIVHFTVKQGYTISEIREKLSKINQRGKA